MMKYEGEKRSLCRPFVMTVCDGEELLVSEFDTAILARTFYEEEHLNTWAKRHVAKWMKELWALRDDGFYGRVAFDITSLGWEETKRGEENFFTRHYFLDWTGKALDTEALHRFYAEFGFSPRKSMA